MVLGTTKAIHDGHVTVEYVKEYRLLELEKNVVGAYHMQHRYRYVNEKYNRSATPKSY
jgi:hypothetical protein